MITFDFDAIELAQQMQRMSEELNIAAPKIVKVEAFLLLKQVIRETSPDSKSQGRAAVKRDLTRAVTPLDPARFTNPKIRQLIERQAITALNAIMQKAKNKWRRWEVVDHFDPAMHTGVRDRRGRVQRFKRKFTVDFRTWKRHLKEVQADVGSAKSSWALAYREVGGTVPEWIAAHDGSRFSTLVSYLRGDKPMITVTSFAKGVVDDSELKREIKRAMETRLKAMVNKTKRMLSDPLKYKKLFEAYQ